MNTIELYQLHTANCPESHFFDDETLRCFGDSLSNYYVKSHDDDTWALCRRNPTKWGLTAPAYFDKTTFEEVFPI